MSTTRASKAVVRELSKDQARRMFDQQAKHYLKISGKEFIRKWDTGQYNNGEADTPAVTRVAMLLPFGR